MIGRTLARYEILEKLGEGGMGEVYKARDLSLGRLVAMKVLHPETSSQPERQRRFVQEARAASALNHPNIVVIHEIGAAEGVSFIAMEWIQGQPLDALIRSRGIDIQTALDYAAQIADALSAAHQAGIIHRDLKPANIMVTAAGLAKVLDFGLAKLTGLSGSDETSATLSIQVAEAPRTQLGTLLGTVAYMSPEQAEGRVLDVRSDIFSFGVVLYEMLTGLRAFPGESQASTLAAVMRDDPRPLTDVVPGAPVELEQIVARCMRKDPERRFQAMTELRAVLKDLAEVLRDPSRRGSGPIVPSETCPASIAVLPFVDMSPEKDQDYFCEGMAEEILNALTRLQGLRVAARTSAFQFKDSRDVRQIGARLGVGLVLDGSVRKSGERLRITAQLVDVAGGFQVWSERYDRDLKDVFAIQDEIAEAVVQALKLQLCEAAAIAPCVRSTGNLEAYNLYLRGRQQWSHWNPEGLQKAIDFFKQAVTLDPNYALAYTGLADSYTVIAAFGHNSPHDLFPLAREAALKAVELNETLPEAQTSLAVVRGFYEYDWAASERGFRRAIELNPGYVTAHHGYAVVALAARKRFAEASAEMDLALSLDPLSVSVNLSAANMALFEKRFDRADEMFAKVKAMAPSLVTRPIYQAHSRLIQSLPREALDILLEGGAPVVENNTGLALLGCAYAMLGNRSEAERVLAMLEEFAKTRYVEHSIRAFIHIGLGEKEDALAHLELAVETRDGHLLYILGDGLLDPIRSEPRFAAVVQAMGLADVALA